MKKYLADHRTVIYLISHAFLIVGGALGALLPYKWSEPVGLSVLAAGVAGYVVLGYVLVSRRIGDQLDVLQRFGLRGAWPARATRIREEYEKRVGQCKDSVDILGFGLNALREDFRNDFAKWRDKAKVRILLIDPEYPTPDHSFAAERDREEARRQSTIRNEVAMFLDETRDIRSDRFQIRLYRCLPTIAMFRIDDEILWGPYFASAAGRNTFTLLAIRGGIMYQDLTEHFNTIWNNDSLSVDAPPSIG